MNRTCSYYWLLGVATIATIAACSNDTPANSNEANSGANDATGGAGAGGSTTAFSSAQNNIGGGSQQAGLSSTGGSRSNALGGGSAADLGGASASGGTSPATSGSTDCGGTLTLGSVSPAQLAGELEQSHTFLLINVHVPVSGTIPGTDTAIDYRDIAAIETFTGTNKSQPVVLYCMSEGMSYPAGTSLVADGYCNVRQVTGGLSAWRSAGYPVDP